MWRRDIGHLFAHPVVQLAEPGFDVCESAREPEHGLVKLGDLAREDLDMVIAIPGRLFELAETIVVIVG